MEEVQMNYKIAVIPGDESVRRSSGKLKRYWMWQEKIWISVRLYRTMWGSVH